MPLVVALFAWWPVTVWQIIYLDRLAFASYTVSRSQIRYHKLVETTWANLFHFMCLYAGLLFLIFSYVNIVMLIPRATMKMIPFGFTHAGFT
jgi:hypothetical protein